MVEKFVPEFTKTKTQTRQATALVFVNRTQRFTFVTKNSILVVKSVEL